MAVMVVTGGPSPGPPGVGDWSARPSPSGGVPFRGYAAPTHTHTRASTIIFSLRDRSHLVQRSRFALGHFSFRSPETYYGPTSCHRIGPRRPSTRPSNLILSALITNSHICPCALCRMSTASPARPLVSVGRLSSSQPPVLTTKPSVSLAQQQHDHARQHRAYGRERDATSRHLMRTRPCQSSWRCITCRL